MKRRVSLAVLACALAALACARTDLPVDYFIAGTPGTTATLAPAVWGTPVPTIPPLMTLEVWPTPTPDPPRASALDRQAEVTHVIQRGDTLNALGARYGVPAAEIARANGFDVSTPLVVGALLRIPLPAETARGPAFKIIPDSELVFGPEAGAFDVLAFAQARSGWLARHTETVDGAYLDGGAARTLSGAAIVSLISVRYSVNPRLLLALLEHRSGWVTNPNPGDSTLTYPLGFVAPGREGLFRQLAFAANQLNTGYYRWRVGALQALVFDINTIKIIDPGLNAGSVAVQYFLAQTLRPEDWARAVAAGGLPLTYRQLFGNPFQRATEPLLPPGLSQPPWQLPFEPGVVWAFTGGPHGGWDTGSAWGALDFAPPMSALGCGVAEAWVTAVADGVVVRSDDGVVALDTDGDGNEGTGWVAFYLHVAAQDRVAVGTVVRAGDRLGHPSCEGGVSNGTHVHLARKYNGEWLPADGGYPNIPFVLDDWVAGGLGREYDGTLTRADLTIEACDCRAPGNEISRPLP